MNARRQPLITVLLDWIVRAAEPHEAQGQLQPARQAAMRQPSAREARSDNNLFALLCRLTC